MEHSYRILSLKGFGTRAICTCGWRSEAYSSAGLAGAAWDAHADSAGVEDEG